MASRCSAASSPTLLSLIVIPAAFTVLDGLGEWFARSAIAARHTRAPPGICASRSEAYAPLRSRLTCSDPDFTR
jgi:hypothetical protein